VEDQAMNSIETAATFFGWCIVVNIGGILLALLVLSVFREGLAAINAKLFGITKEEAKATLFRAFQQYRFAVAFLNVVPYIVLKIMS
jgi:hypothetical protein